jgi:hypothetical protein
MPSRDDAELPADDHVEAIVEGACPKPLLPDRQLPFLPFPCFYCCVRRQTSSQEITKNLPSAKLEKISN